MRVASPLLHAPEWRILPRQSGSRIPWSDVASFCAEFAGATCSTSNTKSGEITFDLGGGEDELSRFLRKVIASVRPEECPNYGQRVRAFA